MEGKKRGKKKRQQKDTGTSRIKSKPRGHPVSKRVSKLTIIRFTIKEM